MRVVSVIANTLAAGFKPVFGIYPWFIIKIQVSYQLHLAYAKGQMPDLSSRKLKYTRPFVSKKIALNTTMKLLVAAMKLCKTHLRAKLSNVEMIAVGFSEQNKVLNGENYNKYLHPHINETLSKTTFLYYVDGVNITSPEIRYLKQLVAVYTMYYKLRLSISPNVSRLLKNYGNQLNTVLTNELKQPINGLEQFVAEQIVEYKVHYKAYKFWLKKMQPTSVLGYCYYNNKINAMLGAANSLGIKAVECQHSAISNNHFAYAKWEYADKLITHFPSHFYVWSEVDKQLVETNFSANSYSPLTEVKGMKHLSQQKLNKTQNASQHILICLQGIWMPEWLETFIREDDNYQWFVRLHPRYPNDKEQLEGLDQLEKINVHTKTANTQSLEYLLRRSKALITCFSGAALEAKALGVKVLIYGEEGKTTYQEYIANGQFSYIENKTSFETSIS